MSKSEQDYYDFAEKRLGPLMTVLLFLAFRNWDKASHYALSPKECHELAEPMANMGPRLEKLFKTPGWVHTVVTSSDDVVTVLMVMISYFERIGMIDRVISVFTPKKKEEEHERSEYTEQVSKNGTTYVDIRGVGYQYSPDI